LSEPFIKKITAPVTTTTEATIFQAAPRVTGAVALLMS